MLAVPSNDRAANLDDPGRAILRVFHLHRFASLPPFCIHFGSLDHEAKGGSQSEEVPYGLIAVTWWPVLQTLIHGPSIHRIIKDLKGTKGG